MDTQIDQAPFTDAIAFFKRATSSEAERKLRGALVRARKQMQVVGEIGQAKEILSGDIEALARMVTERAAATIGCERVNVWLFGDDEARLTCIDAWSEREKLHTRGATLEENQYANEFHVLKHSRYVAASDPLNDPRTSGYVDTYIKPLGISAMLDTLIQLSGKHLGVLCFEHVGRSHEWEPDEIAFAEQLADKLGLALVSRQRLDVEEELRASAARCRMLLDEAPDAVLVYDYDRHSFIDINQSAELLFRCPRDKLAVLGPWHFYSQEEGNAAQIAASVESHNRRALDGEKFTFDRRLRNADGQELICEVRVSRLPGADGCRLLRFSYIDVTERRKVMERLTFANTLLRSEIESSPDGVVVIDASTGLASWNAKFARMWQLSPATLASASPDDVLTDLSHALDQPEAFKADIHAFRRDPAAMVDRELSLLDGRSIECHTGVLSTPGGGVLGRIGFFRDVTARKRAEEALRQSEERFRAVSETAQDAIVTIDGKGKVVYWNGAAERSLGYTRAEAIGMDVHGLMASPVERERAAAGLHAFAQTGTGPILARVRELVARRKDGSEFPIELSVSAVELDSAWHAVAFMRDISERKLSETYIQHLARHDALTGLFNRRVFVDALNHEIGRADRDGTPFAVLYLDLDHFKDINDTLGHPVGDLVLKEVAARLLAVARETDTVARFGGDEFAVLQAGLEDPADAAVFAERMLASIAAPFFIDGNEIRSGTSVGIAMFDVGAEPERLLAQADVALYRAKAEGRGTFRYFTEAMDQEVHTRVRMGAELREAMASGQLFLVYQPQVEVDSGRIVGMEALVRWRHPERGLISPAEFIPIAEKTGLIIAVGQWVLREACRQARAWLDAGVPETLVAVNLSGLQFKSPHELESQVYELLAAHGLAPANLELELTESMLMDASQEHNDVLLRLRARGLRLAIDDFGTGYSSLNYLRRFPVDRIKIAQNFIAELTSNNGDAAIVKAALSLARELHLPAIVEGVETCEQLALLKEWGCREVQGYYYARPLPPDEAAALLRVGLLVPAASE